MFCISLKQKKMIKNEQNKLNEGAGNTNRT